MQKVSRKRLEFACHQFLGMMTRQFFATNPDAQESPVKPLDQYPEGQRSVLMKAVGAALKSADADSDPAYEKWQEQQAAAKAA